MVLDGRLDVRIRDDSQTEPYVLHLAQHQAALVRPGAFLQLINTSAFPCRTLYVVGPTYVFEVDDDGQVVYEDAITLDESWEDLTKVNSLPARLHDAGVILDKRAGAVRRIREGSAASS